MKYAILVLRLSLQTEILNDFQTKFRIIRLIARLHSLKKADELIEN